MQQRNLAKKPLHPHSWEEASNEEPITKWRDTAFQAAVEKLHETHGKYETVMQTGEAFGRGLFVDQLRGQSSEWTTKKWVETAEKDVLRPLGTEFTFTKISDDTVTVFLNRNPRHHRSDENAVSSVFTYGAMRGLFLSAFPKGELLLHEPTTGDQQELIFKTHASAIDKFERERVKRALSSPKTDDGA
jgi:hypothetical protein